ncbi:MAG: hypothetical protein R6V20_08630 [Desulfobia sp.]
MKNIFIALTIALSISLASVPAFATGLEEAEDILLDYINQARNDLTATAAGMGYDISDFEARHGSIPEPAPLEKNEVLAATAASHNEEMSAQDFFSTTSANGTDINQRLLETSLAPAYAGERIAQVAFANYMDPVTAVGNLFKNMLLRELRTPASEPLVLLNPELTLAGINIATGKKRIQGKQYRVYTVVCDLAGDTTQRDQQLLNLINQARGKPMAYAASMRNGKEPKYIPGFHDPSPVVRNQALEQATREHSRDMAENDYFAKTALDGSTPETRAFANGYEYWFAGEVIRTFNRPEYEDMSFREKAGIFVEKAFFNELYSKLSLTEARRPYLILNSSINQAGFGGLYSDKVFTMDMGSKLIPADQAQTVYGIAYNDRNRDHLYQIGEGLPGHTVKIKQIDSRETNEFILHTGNAGGFTTSLQEGEYLAEITVNATRVSKDFRVRENGNFVFLGYTSPQSGF